MQRLHVFLLNCLDRHNGVSSQLMTQSVIDKVFFHSHSQLQQHMITPSLGWEQAPLPLQMFNAMVQKRHSSTATSATRLNFVIMVKMLLSSAFQMVSQFRKQPLP